MKVRPVIDQKSANVDFRLLPTFFLRWCARKFAQMVQALFAHGLAGEIHIFAGSLTRIFATVLEIQACHVHRSCFAVKALPQHCAAPTPHIPRFSSILLLAFLSKTTDHPRFSWILLGPTAAHGQFGSVMFLGDFCRFTLVLQAFCVFRGRGPKKPPSCTPSNETFCCYVRGACLPRALFVELPTFKGTCNPPSSEAETPPQTNLHNPPM